MPLSRIKLDKGTGNVPAANIPTLSASNMPAGSVIQVKHAYHGVNTTASGNSFSSVLTVQFDNDLQTNSKVLVSAHFSATRGTYNSNWGGRVTFYRDTTNLGNDFSLANNSTGGICSQDNTAIAATSMQHLDTSPGTGRPVYKLMQSDTSNGSSTVQIGGNRNNTNYGNTGTMLTIMEIKG